MVSTSTAFFLPYLRMSAETVAEATVLHVEGQIDIATAPALSGGLEEAHRTNGHLIVDFSLVDYLDCAGARILERSADLNRGQFAVVGSKPNVHRVFDLLELTNVLPVMVSIEVALDYLRRPVTNDQQDRSQLTPLMAQGRTL